MVTILYISQSLWYNILKYIVSERTYMKICNHCNIEFKPIGRELVCSIKCKLLDGYITDPNNCWVWKRSKITGGYGKLRWRMKHLSAHKASYEQFVGPIPDGMHVCHKCDKPECINPHHLFLGTPSDNIRDAVNKKRYPMGEKNRFTKFTDEQTKEMLNLKNEGKSYSTIARIFNCTITHVYNVVKKKYRKDCNAVSA